jgi:pimeloyl-ACP methyl ester carboxylesterase
MASRKRVLAIAGAGATVAAVTAFVSQARATRRSGKQFPPPGKLFDAGGFRLHLNISGESHAGPTVILEAGTGSFSANWHWVQQELGRTTRVVSYDRAGLGWSEPSRHPRDARTMAAELRRALSSAAIPGPFVLAGHSLGGLVVRAFADLYPAETAGLVLVDASHPDQWVRWPVPLANLILSSSQRMTGFLARFGLLRAVDLTAAISAGLPARQVAELRALSARPRVATTEANQIAAWEQSRQQLAAATPLGDLPLAVIGVGVQPMGGELLTALQAELPALSSNSARQIVPGATHESLVADQRYAQTVCAAIRAVLRSEQSDSRVQDNWSTASDETPENATINSDSYSSVR